MLLDVHREEHSRILQNINYILILRLFSKNNSPQTEREAARILKLKYISFLSTFIYKKINVKIHKKYFTGLQKKSLNPLWGDILDALYILKKIFLSDFLQRYMIYISLQKFSRLIFLLVIFYGWYHRVTIERKSLSKATYTVKHPRKIFPSCDVFRGVDVCLGQSG